MCDEVIKILSECNSSSSDLVKNCNTCKLCPTSHVALGETVCYIVGAVLINDKGEVLLIQEAKASCKGTWYLPAGRVEQNEMLEDAVKREVLEEAGLEFQPSGLICVEENRARWVRFFFAGRVTGGSLKTLNEADSESLQAMWCCDISSVPLRCHDILRAVKLAKEWYFRQNINVSTRNLRILPKGVSHERIFLQTVFLLDNVESLYILLIKTNSKHRLPVSCYNLYDSVSDSLMRTLSACFKSEADLMHWKPNVIGLLGIEHKGDSALSKDGFCINILAVVEKLLVEESNQNCQLPTLNDKHALWHLLDKKLDIYKSLKKDQRNNLSVPIISLSK